jgi:hypothetical protein
LVAAEEFEVLLPNYDSEFIATLDALYNNREKHTEKRRTGNHKVVELTKPQLHLLGGVQPSYFVGHFPSYAWDTGLARRFIMIFGEATEERSFLEEPSFTTALAQHITKRLGYLFDHYGKAKFVGRTFEIFDQWQLGGGQPRPDHSRLQHYNQSRAEFVLKLALISAVSRTNELLIHEFDLQRAIEWLTNAERYMPDVYRAMKGESDEMLLDAFHQFVQREWIKNKREPVDVRNLANWLAHRTTADKIHRMIDVAEISGYIERVNGDRMYWRPLPRHLHGVE